MTARGICNLVGTATRQNRLSQEIEHHLVERLEAIVVFQIIPKQNVLLEEERVVSPAFDEGDAVGEHLIGSLLLVSKERLAPAAQVVFLEIQENLIDVLRHLAKDIAPIALQVGQPRLHEVRLFGALEVLTPRSYPLFGLQEQAGKLSCNLLGQEL